VSAGGGQGPGGTMEVLTLNVFCHERRPPADDIFLHPRIPASQDVAIEKILAALAATRDRLGNPSATP
jgi:hypothetical protein